MAQVDPLIVTVKRPLNYRDPLFVLIIIALSFFLYGSCERGKRLKLEGEVEKAAHVSQVEAKTAQILILTDSISILKENFKGRVAKDSLALKRKERANSALTQKLAEKRVEIQPMADTIQPLRDYLVLADSLSAAKDTLIYQMEIRHSAQIVDLNGIIKLHERQSLAKDTVNELLNTRILTLEKDLKKETRRKGFWKVTTFIGAGVVGILAVSQALSE